MTTYRLHLALCEDMTGLAKKQRSLEEFLVDFSFSRPLAQYQGLGPVACAALSGDHELVRGLAVAKASLHTRAPSMPEVFSTAGLTPLHLAVWFRSHDLRVLETLLELRADPNDSTMTAAPPLGWCSTKGAVELLVRHGAEVNAQVKGFSRFCPIHATAATGAPCDVVTKLLELRADVHGGKGGLATASPLHLIALCGVCGDSDNEVRMTQLLLESRADINQLCQPEGFMRRAELVFRAYSHCIREPNLLVRFFRDSSTTPLGWSVIFSNEGLLAFLLRARADPEIRNNRGLRPIDFATSTRIQQILHDPGTHIYLLEHNSELTSESL